MRQDLRKALEHLTEKQRTAVTLRYKDRLTLREIGEEMGIGVAAVSRLLQRALTALRAELRVGGLND